MPLKWYCMDKFEFESTHTAVTVTFQVGVLLAPAMIKTLKFFTILFPAELHVYTLFQKISIPPAQSKFFLETTPSLFSMF